MECGNFDVVEFAPTIQCLTGDFRNVANPPRFVREFLDGHIRGRVLFDTKQSEEGGRFYHEQNRNVILLLDEGIELDERDDFIWLTLGQVKEFLRFNNYLNIQVRALIASLQYVWKKAQSRYYGMRGDCKAIACAGVCRPSIISASGNSKQDS